MSTLTTFEEVFAVLFIISMLVSITINSLCLLGMTRRYHRRRFRDYLFISLTICDILRVVFTTPFEVRGLLNHSLSGEEFICKPISFFFYMLEFTSISHILLVVVDRYICLCRPTQALNLYLKPKRIYQAILLSYLNGCFWAFLPLVGVGSYGFQIHEIQCGLKPLHDIQSKVYICLVLILANGVPITISCVCVFLIKKKVNTKIGKVGVNNNNKIKNNKISTTSTNSDNNNSSGNSNENNRNNNNNKNNNRNRKESKGRKDLLTYFAKDKKQVQMILALVLTFIMTWFVYDIILFEEIFFADEPNTYLEVISNFIAHSSALITPIIIFYYNPDLQQTIYRMVGYRRGEVGSKSIRIPKTSDVLSINDNHT